MSISKVNISGTDHQIVGSPRYATCSTAAATAAKVATIADGSSTFSLEKGARICVSFTYANTASAATLNVASTGAKAICWQGSALVSSQYWQAGAVVDFVYDGNGWSIVGVAKDNNSTNFLPLSGGSLTGNLTVGSSSIGTNGYVEGTWLRTTKATESAGNFATISGDGWIYKRAPANVLGDIGGQAKITANGFLKGDGTGGITADKPIFYVTITGTVESPTADKTPAEIYQAYENGYAVYANVTLTGSSSSTNLKGLLPLAYVLAGTDAQYAITFSSISGKEIKEVRYSPAIRKWEVPYSGVIATKDDLPSTPGSIGAQPKITAKGLLKGNGNGVVTAADETEVELVDLPQEVFWATYRSTTYAEIKTAYDAQKVILVKDNMNNVYSLSAFQNNEFAFSVVKCATDFGTLVTTCSCSSSGWRDRYQSDYYIDSAIISLPAASWTGSDPYIQTIAALSGKRGVQANIQLSDTLYDQLVADGVVYLNIENNNGTFTAKAKGGKPSVDLTVQVSLIRGSRVVMNG